jgi:hypothetical protein
MRIFLAIFALFFIHLHNTRSCSFQTGHATTQQFILSQNRTSGDIMINLQTTLVAMHQPSNLTAGALKTMNVR